MIKTVKGEIKKKKNSNGIPSRINLSLINLPVPFRFNEGRIKKAEIKKNIPIKNDWLVATNIDRGSTSGKPASDSL
jgi:hypothetical protein